MHKGIFHIRQIRNGKVIEEFDVTNVVTYEGLNSMLNVAFRAATQITAWFMGLINNSGFTAAANTDTAASHGGWTELTAYSETTRQAWSPAAASAGSIANTVVAAFTINATAVLKGIMIASSNVKGGTAGVLWSAALFGTTMSVLSGDIVQFTYSYSIT